MSSSAKADDPVTTGDYWIPAFAGMTTSVLDCHSLPHGTAGIFDQKCVHRAKTFCTPVTARADAFADAGLMLA